MMYFTYNNLDGFLIFPTEAQAIKNAQRILDKHQKNDSLVSSVCYGQIYCNAQREDGHYVLKRPIV